MMTLVCRSQIIVLAISAFFFLIDGAEDVFMCDSKVWCQGPILEAVNRLMIFNDSKHFVDMPLTTTESRTYSDFLKQFPDASKISADDLKQFLSKYFREPGDELRGCRPIDWKPNPESFAVIKDPELRKWAGNLNDIWLELCREVNESKEFELNQTTLIRVPNIFIAPGGRFREYYYWDTYWIIKGLLVSEMYETVRGIIRNFGSLLQKFGFIPNGGRIYYLQRSQPPLFIPMVYEYFQETSDKAFLHEMMPFMKSELNFWLRNRTTNLTYSGKSYEVFRYNTPSNTPRPEMYIVDETYGNLLPDGSADSKRKLYRNIASTAESGWDFSTRWFRQENNFSSISTTEIAPVDLNAFMCWNLELMYLMNLKMGNWVTARDYLIDWRKRVDIMKELFYDNDEGAWFDFDIVNGVRIKRYYASGAAPLFTGCYDRTDMVLLDKALHYFNKSSVLSYPGGLPTSLDFSGQQWDFPNGWAPLVHMLAEGFRRSGHVPMQDAAKQISKAFVNVTYSIYNRTRHMYEKYNVTGEYFEPGGGGEYDVQIGFGWTNGVVLDFLRTWGNELVAF